MGANTKISWADDTFNPWIGCTEIGPGCDNCYAAALNKRWGKDNWGAGKPRRRTSQANWQKPLKWNREAVAAGKRRRVFCASMADVFDNEVAPEWRADLWRLIRSTPGLDWLVLTKRVGNVEKMLPADWGGGYPNVWLLITVVNQAEAERDIPKLLEIPAAVRGLSIEPQIESIDLTNLHPPSQPEARLDALSGLAGFKMPVAAVPCLDWVICGAESGPHARPFNEDWARTLRDQCQEAGAAFFYKQIIVGRLKIETPELDGRVWAEFPRSREWGGADGEAP